jgi:hypothetical protein
MGFLLVLAYGSVFAQHPVRRHPSAKQGKYYQLDVNEKDAEIAKTLMSDVEAGKADTGTTCPR